MENFELFFENLSPLYKVLWISACLLFFWIIEGVQPLFDHDYKKLKHAGKNFIFLGFTFIINILMGIVAASLFTWQAETQFGILPLLNLPSWAQLIITIAWIDFIAQFGVHYFLHKISWMWRFHMIHHSDTKVDLTTGTRHHPGDYIIRETLAIIATIIIGAPFGFYIFYRMCSVFFTYFTHANVNIPPKIDRIISLVFISPNAHKFHHHFERPWTDSNFGNIFSFWDRIFGTYYNGDPSKVKFGLDVLKDETADDVKYQLKIPFNKDIQTDY